MRKKLEVKRQQRAVAGVLSPKGGGEERHPEVRKQWGDPTDKQPSIAQRYDATGVVNDGQ